MSSKKNPGANQEQKKESWNDTLRKNAKVLYTRELIKHLQDKINAIGYKVLCYGTREDSLKDEDGEPLIGMTYFIDKLDEINKSVDYIEKVLSDKKPIFFSEKELFDYWKEHRLFEESQEE